MIPKAAFVATAALLLLAIFLPAETRGQIALPSLTVQNGGRSEALELRSVSVDVRLEGWLAETVLELEFFNHLRRRQEGEFVLKLPEGATVSSYALDIQGHMRPGVAVEKEKARNAYESIKRRQVDPGLVEREAGNIYRTRIFPIEPGQPKRVRIGFIHPLGAGGEYMLPLRHDKVLAEFSCKVSGAREAPVLTSRGLDAEATVAGFKAWEWNVENVELNGELKALSEHPRAGEAPRVRIESQPQGGAHFLVQGRLPQRDEGGAVSALDPRWKQVRVLWDTSLSGRWRDHQAEFKALQRLWQWIGDGEVRLQLVGVELSGPQVFPIRNGQSRLIEEELRKVSYDGAADFSRIEPWTNGVTVLVSDGQLSAPMWDLRDAVGQTDFFLLDSTGRAVGGTNDPRQLGGAAQRLDLNDEGWWKTLTGTAAGIRVIGLARQDYDITFAKGTFAVSGRLPRNLRGKARIRLAGGTEIEINPANAEADEQAADEWSFVRRIWAQRRLATLEGLGSRQQIAEFAEAERLVSDFTSLIVLELMADHVRYRIPPPEPILRDEYERRIETDLERTIRWSTSGWDDKITWHRTEYPWIDADLSAEVSTVSIWVKAAHTAFPQEKLNRRQLAPYEKWLDEAKQVIAARDSLNSAFDYRAWVAQLEEKLTVLTKLRDQPANPKAGDPLHVAVRGFVDERGIFSAEKGKKSLTLRKAVEAAGGPNLFGSWSRVYLYRDARRTGYNMDSSEFKAVPLQWGDMVVVESVPRYNYRSGPVDPFFGGDEPGLSSTPRDRAPVFEDSNSTRSARRIPTAPTFLSEARGGGGAGGGGNRENDPADAAAPGLVGRFADDEELAAPLGVDEEIIEALRDHTDPEKHYRELLRGDFGKAKPSVATVIEMARLFFGRKQHSIGEQVLTNLMELYVNPVEATRSYAFWLAEFGRQDRALEILTALAEAVGDNDSATLALVNYDAGQISASAEFFFAAAEARVGDRESGPLTIALTDYFARGGKSQGLLRSFQRHKMPSDVRIVISWAGGEAGPAVTEPDLLADDLDHGAWTMRDARTLPQSRVYEYQMRRALPGNYKVKVHRRHDGEGPLTLRVDYYLDWAGAKQQRKTMTLLMEKWQLNLPDLEFGWVEEEKEGKAPANPKANQ